MSKPMKPLYKFCLILLAVGLIIGYFNRDLYDTTSSYNSSASTIREVKSWNNNAYITDLEKEKRGVVRSKEYKSDTKMSFPYTGTSAEIVVCKSNKEFWAYVEFDNTPNIVNSETQKGYNIIKANVYIDGKKEIVTMTQEWGSKLLHFKYPNWVIEKLKSSNDFRLQLNWYGEDMVVWSFNSTDFTKEYDLMIKKFEELN